MPLVKRVRRAREHRRAARIAAQERGGLRRRLWPLKVLHVVHLPDVLSDKDLIPGACDAPATLSPAYTLSPSVEVAARALWPPQVQFLISGMSSPTRRMYSR